MDPIRFDSLSRELSFTRSRRGVVAAIVGSALGLHGLSETVAKHKKKHKKKSPPPPPPPGSSPSPGSPPPPSCPEGQRFCRGTCQSVLICCDDTDCAGGRTCKAGTCGCPADKPRLCPGSTICQQCCVKADCSENPNTGPGIPECVANSCVCSQAGRRYCPNRGRCGTCCDDAECTNGERCTNPNAAAPIQCMCAIGRRHCTAAGRTGCIDGDCCTDSTCANACGVFCNPNNGDAACPCSAELVCDFDPATQDCCYCRARSAG